MNTMKRLFLSFVAALAFFAAAPPAFSQSVTPNTTLCGAVTISATSICLTSTTGVGNQAGLYIEGEYMMVSLSASQTLAASNAFVPVTRGNRFAGSGPAPHNNSTVVWIAETPLNTTFPGDNGFEMGSPQIYTFEGACTRGAFAFMPRIIPDRNLIRDCNVPNGGTAGFWVDFNPTSITQPSANGFQLLTTNGAIPVTSGNFVITKAGVLAGTLAAPTAGLQDGTIIKVMSSTANAHTITATGLLQTGTASVNVATFAAQAGAGVTLMAFNGKWIVIYSVGITFS